MNISEAARRSGLPPKTLRYYEAIELVLPSRRMANGYRDYDTREVHLLRFVHRARSLGFSVEACRELLDLYRDRERASADVRALALERIGEIERKMTELGQMKRTLERLVEACHGDERPDCPILDELAGEEGALEKSA